MVMPPVVDSGAGGVSTITGVTITEAEMTDTGTTGTGFVAIEATDVPREATDRILAEVVVATDATTM